MQSSSSDNKSIARYAPELPALDATTSIDDNADRYWLLREVGGFWLAVALCFASFVLVTIAGSQERPNMALCGLAVGIAGLGTALFYYLAAHALGFFTKLASLILFAVGGCWTTVVFVLTIASSAPTN